MFLEVSQHIYTKGVQMETVKNIRNFDVDTYANIMNAIGSGEERVPVMGILDVVFYRNKKKLLGGVELYEIAPNGDLKKIGDNYDTTG